MEAPGSRLEHAVACFNESQAGRTVAGLARSLGRPSASIGAAAGASNEVRVTVAWELCWYQWGVDLSNEQGRVFEIAKGEELEQLDRSARQWNASVGKGGQLLFGAAGRRPVRRAFWLRRR